jgi:hypothetical protein
MSILNPISIHSIKPSENLIEVRVGDKGDIKLIAQQLNKPLLVAKDFMLKHMGLDASKRHSFLAVIDGNTIYKHIFDVERGDENESKKSAKRGNKNLKTKRNS